MEDSSSFTITKRTKIPLKSASPDEVDHEEQQSKSAQSVQSGQSAQSSTNNNNESQRHFEVEFSVSDIEHRKDELNRIINEEEDLRKKSLLNLKEELDSMMSMETEVENKSKEIENGPSNNNGHVEEKIHRTNSRAYSIESSQWTSDEEGGVGSTSTGKKKSKHSRRRRNTFTDEELEKIPRLVHRNMPFKQSRQEIAVVNKTLYKGLKVQRILSQDWYHVILRWNSALSILILLLLWTSVIITFAFIYMKLDAISPETECGLGTAGNPIQFGPAFAFSLETCTTVGYGLPNGTNSFFEPECTHLQIAIYFQMVFSMLFNAFLFAFLFARLARCEQRGAQVLFSDKAIIEKRNGKWLMHVRVYDYASSLPIVEAHVRMYCVSWRDYEKQTRDLVQPHLLHAMRVLQPDDELGSSLFTSIPLNVTHQIDTFSPLLPKKHKKLSKRLDGGGLQLRQIDQFINGVGLMCPVCGESFGCQHQLRKHINYNALVERMEAYPIKGSHQDPDIVGPVLEEPQEITENDIREHLKDKEIMCVVEGIEPMVSGTFQALQSYKIKDIYFGGRFAPCMSQQNGKIFVDIDRFHEILPPSDESVRNFHKYHVSDTY